MDTCSERRPISLQELQKIEFDILREFRDFCDKNNLRYYLCGGTLIGAIRHQGFIPWDDDIDVMMPRPDYMNFLELNQNGWLDDIRKIDYIYMNQDAMGSFARIVDTRTEVVFLDTLKKHKLGCWIDIYPIDGMNNTKLGRIIHCRLGRLISDLAIAAGTRMGSKRRNKFVTILQYGLIPFLPLIRMVSSETYFKAMDKLAQSHKYETSKYVGVLDGRALDREAMIKRDMEPPIIVNFCGEKFTAMANYNEYLTNLYGDYMTPPKEVERVSRHRIEFFWKI